jgi:hypothetical protein
MPGESRLQNPMRRRRRRLRHGLAVDELLAPVEAEPDEFGHGHDPSRSRFRLGHLISPRGNHTMKKVRQDLGEGSGSSRRVDPAG